MKPIIFSGQMVQAILAGRKTQTRRIMKPQPAAGWWDISRQFSPDGNYYDKRCNPLFWIPAADGKEVNNRYGKPGDLLWVRETWYDDADFGEDPIYVYRADSQDFPRGSSSWKPSIHMPKSAARIFLHITNICVERLQDISEEDAKAEGTKPLKPLNTSEWRGDHHFAFSRLWANINGQDSWYENPWVWVVSFERVERPHWWGL